MGRLSGAEPHAEKSSLESKQNDRVREISEKSLCCFTRLRTTALLKGTNVSEQQLHFMNLFEGWPARLTMEQVAKLLNCKTYDIPVLVAAKLLKPLGSPPPCGVKYFSTVEVLELKKNPAWLAKMTNTLYRFWQGKNARRLLSKSKHMKDPAVAA